MASDKSQKDSAAKTAAKTDTGGGLGETIRTIGFAILVALVVRTFLFEPFNIPSRSMVPTLLKGDYLFVSKFSYGYSKHSLPFSPPLFNGRIFESQPERGDVAVFKFPADNETDYIKRIVGLPGDRIQVLSGILHINGEPATRRRMPDYSFDRPAYGSRIRYREILPGGVAHEILEEDGDLGRYDNTSVYVVPKGHYFAMGDNRDNSNDSRVLNEVGFVPAENLVGKALFLFFSTDGTAKIWEVWKWPFTIRYDRLFNGID